MFSGTWGAAAVTWLMTAAQTLPLHAKGSWLCFCRCVAHGEVMQSYITWHTRAVKASRKATATCFPPQAWLLKLSSAPKASMNPSRPPAVPSFRGGRKRSGSNLQGVATGVSTIVKLHSGWVGRARLSSEPRPLEIKIIHRKNAPPWRATTVYAHLVQRCQIY